MKKRTHLLEPPRSDSGKIESLREGEVGGEEDEEESGGSDLVGGLPHLNELRGSSVGNKNRSLLFI